MILIILFSRWLLNLEQTVNKWAIRKAEVISSPAAAVHNYNN